jgi:hypothetical protein
MQNDWPAKKMVRRIRVGIEQRGPDDSITMQRHHAGGLRLLENQFCEMGHTFLKASAHIAPS